MVKGKQKKKAPTIAGNDSSGGAGIQADIKTMTMNGVIKRVNKCNCRATKIL